MQEEVFIHGVRLNPAITTPAFSLAAVGDPQQVQTSPRIGQLVVAGPFLEKNAAFRLILSAVIIGGLAGSGLIFFSCACTCPTAIQSRNNSERDSFILGITMDFLVVNSTAILSNYRSEGLII